MFTLFEKPIGIQITSEGIVLVRVAKEKAVPKLKEQSFRPLASGCVDQDGNILNPESLVKALKELQALTGATECAVALPASKSYSSILSLPAAMGDEDIELTLSKKTSSLLPFSAEDLVLQHSILRAEDGGTVYAFLSGVEKQTVELYRKVFAEAGWGKVHFIEEGLALAQVIPARFSEVPALMFVHLLSDDEALVSSVFHERLFNSFHSKNLAKDLPLLHEDFYQETEALPTHIILSGDPSKIAALEKLPFKQRAPQMAPAEFRVSFEGKEAAAGKFLIATGLALGLKVCRKRGGLILIDLLT